MTSLEERSFAAQLEERVALYPEDEPGHVLVGGRAVLIAFVLNLAGARGEAPLAVPVEDAHPLDRVVRVQSSSASVSIWASAAVVAVSRARSSSCASASSSAMRSRRIRAGSVSPWTTSVKKMTAKVRKMISSRWGNGRPPCVVRGSANAEPAG